MTFLYSLFFAAGIAAFVFSKLGQRVGAGNVQSIWGVVAGSFIFAFIFFFTLLAFVLHIN